MPLASDAGTRSDPVDHIGQDVSANPFAGEDPQHAEDPKAPNTLKRLTSRKSQVPPVTIASGTGKMKVLSQAIHQEMQARAAGLS